MIIVRPARGSGKTYLMRQRIKKAIESGENVLLVRKSGFVVINKNGTRQVPSGKWQVPENIQRRLELISADYQICEELADGIKTMEEVNSCKKSK